MSDYHRSDPRSRGFREKSTPTRDPDNARKLGRMTDRTHCELTGEDIARIAGTYHPWRDLSDDDEDMPGFCKRPRSKGCRARPRAHAGTLRRR